MVVVRSVALGVGALDTQGTWAIAICPEGITLLIKQVDVYAFTAAALACSLWLTRPSLQVSVSLFVGDVAPTTPTFWSGWVVLMPGDELQLAVPAAPLLHYWVSGTALHGVETLYQLPSGNTSRPSLDTQPAKLPPPPR